MTALSSAPVPSPSHPCEPTRECPLCPRLVRFREQARAREPNWHNAPVPSFGSPDARVLIVGLAPGLRGANRTGRPFTGDYAGTLLYQTLSDVGLSRGTFDARPDDGLVLIDTMLTNAVRCVPPENKPTGEEIATCRPFLAATMAAMPKLRVMVALGRIAHESALRALGASPARFPFRHAARHEVGRVVLHDSYHCSRYNTQTRRLTPEMFRAVFDAVRADLG